MVNFRHRIKGKGKRWKKGYSSSSNPDIRRHRNVAKSKFFQEHPGKSLVDEGWTLHVMENCGS
jgi:ribosomal RNA-processing protein 12